MYVFFFTSTLSKAHISNFVAGEAHLIRHAGVLGMAAIVGAFPYTV